MARRRLNGYDHFSNEEEIEEYADFHHTEYDIPDDSDFDYSLDHRINFELNNSIVESQDTKRQFWRKQEPVLDEDGRVMIGGMFPSQLKYWNMKKFYKAFIGGYGSGKSTIACKRAVSVSLTNGEDYPYLLVSPSYKVAKRTVIPTLRALLNGKKSLYPDEFRWEENKTDFRFEIQYRNTKGVIWIGSGDNPDALRGSNLGGGGIDEPFIQSEEVFLQLDARVRGRRIRQKEISLFGTPEAYNWGYDYIEGSRKDEIDFDVIQVSTIENKVVGKEYYDRLYKSLSSRARDAYLHGHFVNLSTGRVYYAFDEKVNVQKIEYWNGKSIDEYEEFLGLDFNVNPMFAVVFCVLDERRAHVKKEIVLEDSHTDMMCNVVREEHPGINTIYPDATGAHRKTSARGETDFTIIQNYGFEIDAGFSNPAIGDRDNVVNGLFDSDNLNEYGLTIDPQCTQLRKSLNSLTHENRMKAEGKKLTHGPDSMGYPMHRLFPIERINSSTLVQVRG